MRVSEFFDHHECVTERDRMCDRERACWLGAFGYLFLRSIFDASMLLHRTFRISLLYTCFGEAQLFELGTTSRCGALRRNPQIFHSHR